MLELTAKLDLKIKKVCPIVGITVSREREVTIDYDPSATEQQRAAAAAVVAAFDWTDAAAAAARAELAAGYTVTPEGWTLRATPEAQAAIDKLVSHVERLLDLGRITTKTLVTILDATGTPRQVTALRLREIASDYGERVRQLEMILRS